LLIEANLLVAYLFASARRLLQRDRQTIALLRQEQHHLDAVSYHRSQYLRDWAPQGSHFVLARFESARFRRTRDELSMLQSGKDYWQLHDIEKTARLMRQLEKDRSPELALMWERIPTDAIVALHKRMTELRREEELERDRADSAATERLTRGVAWWMEQDQAPIIRLER
jgi:hypothetical protein